MILWDYFLLSFLYLGVEPPFRPNGCHYDKPKEKHMIKDVKTENVFVLGLFKYILDHKLLSPEEENELGILAMTGNLKARNKLVSYADSRENNVLPIKVDFILDEFGSFVGSCWANKLTAARSRGIRFVFALQYSQRYRS